MVGCRDTSFEPINMKIALNVMDKPIERIDRSIDGYVNTKTTANQFLHACAERQIMAELIPIKFCTSIAWADIVIYLKWHPN